MNVRKPGKTQAWDRVLRTVGALTADMPTVGTATARRAHMRQHR